MTIHVIVCFAIKGYYYIKLYTFLFPRNFQHILLDISYIIVVTNQKQNKIFTVCHGFKLTKNFLFFIICRCGLCWTHVTHLMIPKLKFASHGLSFNRLKTMLKALGRSKSFGTFYPMSACRRGFSTFAERRPSTQNLVAQSLFNSIFLWFSQAATDIPQLVFSSAKNY